MRNLANQYNKFPLKVKGKKAQQAAEKPKRPVVTPIIPKKETK